jgi:GMP reductase
VVEENGEKFMLFYGMSSESAMTRHVGGVAKYRAAEGKTVKLPLRGPVEYTRAISSAACALPAPTLGHPA